MKKGAHVPANSFRQLSKKVQLRTAEVECNELKEFIDPKHYVDETTGEELDLLITVRGLTGRELYNYRNVYAEANCELVEGLLDSLKMQDHAGFGDAVSRLSGKYPDNEVPLELKKQRYMLMRGAVAPKLGNADTHHMSEFFPVVFERLTNKVLELTGLGAELKKKPK